MEIQARFRSNIIDDLEHGCAFVSSERIVENVDSRRQVSGALSFGNAVYSIGNYSNLDAGTLLVIGRSYFRSPERRIAFSCYDSPINARRRDFLDGFYPF